MNYASPADETGDITIALKRRGETHAELSVRDNASRRVIRH